MDNKLSAALQTIEAMECIQDDLDIRTVGDSGSTTNSDSDRVNDDTDLNNIIVATGSLATTAM
jgi:hypothetical protein